MDILKAIEQLDRLIFTTREVAALAEISLSSASQRLERLAQKKLIGRIKHGLWGKIYDKRFSPLLVVPFLLPGQQCYVSFISALHMHGIISQIPQVVTVASTAHSKNIATTVGTFRIFQLAPSFFDGFEWSANGAYLIATPEKALIDCLYISSRKGRQFAHFPELELRKNFDRKKAMMWVNRIKDQNIRSAVFKRLLDFQT